MSGSYPRLETETRESYQGTHCAVNPIGATIFVFHGQRYQMNR